MAYALILESSASRAAQYAYLVERAELTAVICREPVEAVFQMARLGPPALIIAGTPEPGVDSVSLLRELRKQVAAGAAPAVVIVDTRQAHDAVARQMIQLGVSALMLRSQTLSALQKVIRSAVSPAPRTEPPPPQLLEVPAPPRRSDPAAELAVAERLADDPLVTELATLPLAGEGSIEERLSRIAAASARAFGTTFGIVWLTHGDRSWFKLEPDVVPARARAPAAWTALRAAIGADPIHVGDSTSEVSLANAPPVRNGLVGSFAGAPLLAANGQPMGAIAVADPRPGGVAPGVVEPLIFWAGRIASEMMPPEPRTRSPAKGGVSASHAIEAAVSALGSAILVTDWSGAVCFANPLLKDLLGLRVVRVAGLRRADVVRALAADDAVVNAIRDASGSPGPLEFAVARPKPRVLRWESRPIALGGHPGRVDEFRDVTADAEHFASVCRVDTLTGLPDRRGADELLGREVSRALRIGEPLGVALFGVDGLEVLDPAAADGVLRGVAWVLRESLRGYDVAARFGPRELLAVLPGATAEQVSRFGQRFCREVREMRVEGIPRVTVSGGCAQFDGESSVDAMLELAATRLAEAKAAGGDRTL